MGSGGATEDVLARLASLRQHQQGGKRSPHKPLLVLLALGRMAATGSSQLPWREAEEYLARLRADGVWVLNADVEMDHVRPLAERHVVGHFDPALEAALRADPALVRSAARALVTSNFPETVAPDVLEAVGLDPAMVLAAADVVPDPRRRADERRRDQRWRWAVLEAWDRQCAFCGYDGQLGGASVGVEAAHVRWFGFGGPDALDNGLALCVLHHKLFDLGALGLDADLRVLVSATFTARTAAGRMVYELHGRELSPRPGTKVPAAGHVAWHAREVFKGEPLAA